MILPPTATSTLFTVTSVMALVSYLLAAVVPQGRGPAVALVLGWLAHLVAGLSDMFGWGLAGEGARFGFAPALSVTFWMVLAVYHVESRLLPLPGPRRVLAVLGALTVVLAWLFPGELHPQRGSPWAPVHWLLGFASYGLFGVAVLHAAMLGTAERRMRTGGAGGAATGAGLPLLRLEKLTFRFVGAGFIVLTLSIAFAMTVLHPWRWDHKAVFSALGWAVFAALLIGRRGLGWRGRQATRWLYSGAALLLLAYVGSRFVLEVLLRRAPGP